MLAQLKSQECTDHFATSCSDDILLRVKFSNEKSDLKTNGNAISNSR